MILPLSAGDSPCTAAIPGSAVLLGAGPYQARVFRSICDLRKTAVLHRLVPAAAAPFLRVSAPKDATPAQGVIAALDLLPKQYLRYR